MKDYNQLTLYDRQKIEEGLNDCLGFRAIARTIERSPSTVSREVKENRTLKAVKAQKSVCRNRNWCKFTAVCEVCRREGAICATCDIRDCQDMCKVYLAQITCERLTKAPWVCNGCRKNKYGCNRHNRMVYLAKAADVLSTERRSVSRQGFDMTSERAGHIAAVVRPALKRGLSPYEVSVLYADMVDVSVSTLYRMIEAGIGDMANIDLERKVGFKPRAHTKPRSQTRHSKERNYEAFSKLSEDRKAAATEMDTVEGRKCDRQCLLTLYHKPSHIHLAFLMSAQECDETKGALVYLGRICPPSVFKCLAETVLTDNGGEMADEDGIDAIFGGTLEDPHLFYCDPRRSDQKPHCEKNHSEIRQILPKVITPMDEVDDTDVAVALSHVNSSPRKVLCGKSPIQMFLTFFGSKGRELLDNLGIKEIHRDKIVLKPEILDIERKKRGLPPLFDK